MIALTQMPDTKCGSSEYTVPPARKQRIRSDENLRQQKGNSQVSQLFFPGYGLLLDVAIPPTSGLLQGMHKRIPVSMVDMNRHVDALGPTTSLVFGYGYFIDDVYSAYTLLRYLMCYPMYHVDGYIRMNVVI